MKTKQSLLLTGLILAVILSSCKPKTTTLWNGKDFTGWHFVLQDSSISPSDNWIIKRGVIHCFGKGNGYMRTEKVYENYELEVDWRWSGKPGNSGVLLNMQKPDKVWPHCVECQLQAGNAGDFILNGGGSIEIEDSLYNSGKSLRIPKIHNSTEKPAGEWNHYRITNTGNGITCYVNGVLQNKGRNSSLKKGYICLQSEGAPIEFRNIRLKPFK